MQVGDSIDLNMKYPKLPLSYNKVKYYLKSDLSDWILAIVEKENVVRIYSWDGKSKTVNEWMTFNKSGSQ